MRIELKMVEKYSHLLLALCFLLLLMVFLPGIGSTVNGARRWINLGIVNFQAVEAVKLMFIVWLASYLVRYRDEIGVSLDGAAQAARRGRRIGRAAADAAGLRLVGAAAGDHRWHGLAGRRRISTHHRP